MMIMLAYAILRTNKNIQVISTLSKQRFYCCLIAQCKNPSTRIHWFEMCEAELNKIEDEQVRNRQIVVLSIVYLNISDGPYKMKWDDDATAASLTATTQRVLGMLEQVDSASKDSLRQAMDTSGSKVTPSLFGQNVLIAKEMEKKICITGCKAAALWRLGRNAEAGEMAGLAIIKCKEFEHRPCSLGLPAALGYAVTVCKELRLKAQFQEGIRLMLILGKMYPVIADLARTISKGVDKTMNIKPMLSAKGKKTRDKPNWSLLGSMFSPDAADEFVFY